ncbi:MULTISPECIES: RNA polymerase sigma factor [unclassified Imperialibacter]|uniref:RNA polymerase sigma factor n=1 Tax=unclassified Imperialibacter TaxID=2629706 RepID=UPI00125A5467|nr:MULTISPECIES: RNA polymerase sigma-70 factor [unclassified Imperialibacter]CAD5270315.1 RNA polymerase sigma-70 factor, ECF subfamily [Imperialibacter sp. 89]CAD5298134.1 RNA polymerase sigma-70 factor, ECF subfamily [Imperialibacter sp. 75]VVT34298.1 RNA polymerase sigma-70 factor, ECF subfamily [Imperialibacter sp. EC-SDR9]
MKVLSSSYANDNELLEAFQRGEKDAFIVIYERFWNRIFLIAYKSTRNKEVSEDLVQNLFLKLWDKRDLLHIKQIEAYLHSSIRNSVIDYIHSQVVRNKYLDYLKVSPPAGENNTDRMMAVSDLSKLIEEGLTQLPEKSRSIFRMNRLDHSPVEEIAQKLKISEKAVQYHLTKSLKVMRLYLKSIIFSLLLIFLG